MESSTSQSSTSYHNASEIVYVTPENAPFTGSENADILIDPSLLEDDMVISQDHPISPTLSGSVPLEWLLFNTQDVVTEQEHFSPSQSPGPTQPPTPPPPMTPSPLPPTLTPWATESNLGLPQDTPCPNFSYVENGDLHPSTGLLANSAFSSPFIETHPITKAHSDLRTFEAADILAQIALSNKYKGFEANSVGVSEGPLGESPMGWCAVGEGVAYRCCQCQWITKKEAGLVACEVCEHGYCGDKCMEV
ncbi:hypothetical protein K469DRAFT_802492 [Zopfia rhizophila CBS 207.26]|uniref:Uncharacterized protein n=1 Tax=Zopfia rhizophila CBS 207.26 TaxID=1314779 RepID=A0A6A6DGQ2_9PEZI|nr:hypothetical protein K469DRAFT_802492 [Zopfia rhizophila CBS 207.26]